MDSRPVVPTAPLTTAQTSDRYRPIADYGIIGDCHTAALVASNGSIDWCCLPRFDAPAVFCRILDADRGGFWQICPSEPARSRQEYVPGTNVLQTHFETAEGTATLTDLMPVAARQGPVVTDERDPVTEETYVYRVRVRHEILRRVEGQAGRVRFQFVLWPTFDYARQRCTIERFGRSVLFATPSDYLAFVSPVDLGIRDEAVIAEFTVGPGDRLDFVLTHEPTRQAALGELYPLDGDALLADTLSFWSNWSAQCTYRGPYEDVVQRSALTLKLLTYEPTGAIVAAPTTSLPEEIGGVRNWDYRYTWLRDATLTLYGLFILGYVGEATDFFHWIEGICAPGDCAIQIMYGIDGRRELPESVLSHLEGYRESRPVRIGNAAVEQRQLDVFGAVLDSAYLYHKYGGRIDADLWCLLARLADQAARDWWRPDHGIWEVRTGMRHFVYSKVMCWVALDRAIRLATRLKLPGKLREWQRVRAAIHQSVLQNGYDPQAGAFMQSYGSRYLDACALTLPLVGFLAPTDRRVVSTVEQIRANLMVDGLVYRYWGPDDGLPGGEGSFVICTTWLIDNLALQGRLSEAYALYEGLLDRLSPLGLLAEEIEPANRQLLGNFPQGFSHIGLINSAINLQKAGYSGPEWHPKTLAERQLEALVVLRSAAQRA